MILPGAIAALAVLAASLHLFRQHRQRFHLSCLVAHMLQARSL